MCRSLDGTASAIEKERGCPYRPDALLDGGGERPGRALDCVAVVARPPPTHSAPPVRRSCASDVAREAS